MSQNTPASGALCSVCCLSYNHAKFIEQNLQSIWSQSYQNIEIIALDDGSPDGSAALLQSLQEKSPLPMKVIAQKNTGSVSKNFNTLMANASGKYLIFISCDDKLVEGHLESKILLMEEDPHLSFVVSKKYYNIDDTDCVLSEEAFEQLNEQTSVASLLQCEYDNVGTFYIQNAIFRKAIVDAVGGFDEDLLGDDIVLRTKIFLYMQKHPELSFKISDDYGLYYRTHDHNMHKNVFRQVTLVLEFLDRYAPDRDIPKLLVDWIMHGFHHMPFEEALKMFFINEKAFNLLLDGELQYFIESKCPDSSMYHFFSVALGQTKVPKCTYLNISPQKTVLYRSNFYRAKIELIRKVLRSKKGIKHNYFSVSFIDNNKPAKHGIVNKVKSLFSLVRLSLRSFVN